MLGETSSQGWYDESGTAAHLCRLPLSARLIYTEGSGELQGALLHAQVHRKCHIDIIPYTYAYTQTHTTVWMLQPLS